MPEKLISELLDLPERVRKGDFVLNLSKGVSEPDKTLSEYVVTPQLVACFDDALDFIKSAVDATNSKACYLHGSFGAGKSHFMAVQITRLAIGRIDGRLDEVESVVEAGDQLRRHDIVFERLLGLGDAFGQVENEVAFADLFRQDQQVADEFLRHG